MVDGQYRNYGEWAWRRFLKRPRGNHDARPERCAWILDASGPRACPRFLKKGEKGPYCKKHLRSWNLLKEKP